MSQTIINGDSLEELKLIKDDTIDAVITDPPYGIAFLGKDWDSFRATRVARSQRVKNLGTGMRMTTHRENLNYQEWCEQWARECLRVLKPGGWLLAFSAARLYHRIAAGIEDAGFEVRDQIMWIYASGFPKAQDIGKAIDKRGGMVSNDEDTKSLKNMLIELFKASGKSRSQINTECGFNASGYLRQHDNGVDGWASALPLNDKWQTLKRVLGCGDDYDRYFISSERAVVGTKQTGCFDQDFESHTIGARSRTVEVTAPATQQANQWHGWKTSLKPAHEPIVMARKPFKGSTIDNVLKHGVGALNIDATRIAFENNDKEKLQKWANKWDSGISKTEGFDVYGNSTHEVNEQGRFPSNVVGEIPDYQKYFYCPKVSRAERHRGFEQQNIPTNPEGMLDHNGGTRYVDGGNKQHNAGNNHPTVKPVELMKYLIKLVTPSGAHILDPFAGSGTTGMACRELARTFTGIDLDPRYCEIARRRIAATQEDKTETLFE